MEWAHKQGVVIPKVEWPANFNGLPGMKCIEDIEHREGFLFVPFKMMITLGKALNHPVLEGIILQNPHIFTDKVGGDWE